MAFEVQSTQSQQFPNRTLNWKNNFHFQHKLNQKPRNGFKPANRNQRSEIPYGYVFAEIVQIRPPFTYQCTHGPHRHLRPMARREAGVIYPELQTRSTPPNPGVPGKRCHLWELAKTPQSSANGFLAHPQRRRIKLVWGSKGYGPESLASSRNSRSNRTMLLPEKWQRKSSSVCGGYVLLGYFKQHIQFQVWENGNYPFWRSYNHRSSHPPISLLLRGFRWYGKRTGIQTQHGSPASAWLY